jgi:hypothetical protein
MQQKKAVNNSFGSQCGTLKFQKFRRRPQQQECYCEVALQEGYNCGLDDWRPEHPKAFLQGIVQKLEDAIMEDWAPDRSGKLCLPDVVICPAEALWIAQSLRKSIKAAKA